MDTTLILTRKNELIFGDMGVPIYILNVIARRNVTLAHKYSLWNFGWLMKMSNFKKII